MLKSPCNGCNERYKNCHAHCEDYIDYQNEISEIKRNRQKEFSVNDYEIEQSIKINRRRGKKKW